MQCLRLRAACTPVAAARHRRLFACPPRAAAMTTSSLEQATEPARLLQQRPLFSVAPMLDWTDVQYRQVARLLSRHTWLWTEMVVDQTIIHTDNRDKHLWFPPEQHPIVCQMGGSNPETLAKAARVVASYGYDEINLNCGCPSDRVAGAGCFGAAMMLRPQLVADCCAAIAEASGLPVSVKCRVGVDDQDTYEQLHAFIRTVSEGAPVRHFIIHARKCLLQGLNPHQNRTVPPLRYEWVWALRRDFPHLRFSLNGGVQTVEEAAAALALEDGGLPSSLSCVGSEGDAGSDTSGSSADGEGSSAEAGSCTDSLPGNSGDSGSSSGSLTAALAAAIGESQLEGVMVGRQAYYAPWDLLAGADVALFGAEANAAASRRQVLQDYARWADGMIGRWRNEPDGKHVSPSVRALMRPVLNLFHNEPRGKKWRAAVDGVLLKGASSVSQVLEETLPVLKPETLDAPPRPLGALPPELAHYSVPLPVVGEGQRAGSRQRDLEQMRQQQEGQQQEGQQQAEQQQERQQCC